MSPGINDVNFSSLSVHINVVSPSVHMNIVSPSVHMNIPGCLFKS